MIDDRSTRSPAMPTQVLQEVPIVDAQRLGHASPSGSSSSALWMKTQDYERSPTRTPSAPRSPS